MVEETGSSASASQSGPDTGRFNQSPSMRSQRTSNSTGGDGDALGSARNAIADVASQTGAKVASSVNAQKAKAADSLGNVAQALRHSSEELRSNDSGLPMHQYISTAADRVERWSDYVRSSSVADMMSEVEQFARRQPAIFIGGAMMLGLLGARFLKSSSRSDADAPSPARSTGPAASTQRNSSSDPRTSAGYEAARERETF